MLCVRCGRPRLTSTPQDQLFADNAETCDDAWTSSDGQQASFTTDAEWVRCAPLAGGRVTVLGSKALASSWFKPIAVTPGLPNCLSVAIRWSGGARPFVAARLFGYEGTAGVLKTLIGPGTDDGLGGLSTPVPSAGPAWQYHRKSFTVPADVRWMQIETGLDASASKPGEAGSSIDDVQVVRGTCPQD